MNSVMRTGFLTFHTTDARHFALLSCNGTLFLVTAKNGNSLCCINHRDYGVGAGLCTKCTARTTGGIDLGISVNKMKCIILAGNNTVTKTKTTEVAGRRTAENLLCGLTSARTLKAATLGALSQLPLQ